MAYFLSSVGSFKSSYGFLNVTFKHFHLYRFLDYHWKYTNSKFEKSKLLFGVIVSFHVVLWLNYLTEPEMENFIITNDALFVIQLWFFFWSDLLSLTEKEKAKKQQRKKNGKQADSERSLK